MNLIRLPGDPQGRPPYLGRGVLMHAGLITADPNCLGDLVDLTLNRVDPDLFFQSVGSKVLMAALYADRMSSDHPEDREFGSVPEVDIGLWVLTTGGRRDAIPLPRWMPAFIFVDSASALMTGRELYGYPKQFGRMIRRGVADADFRTSLRAVSFLAQDSNEIGREHEVLRIEAASQAGAAGHNVELQTLLETFDAAIDAEDNGRAGKVAIAPPFLGMPMVFLRQMRDVADAEGATMQEIAAALVEPTTVYAGGFADGHRLVLDDNATFRIAATLGCATTVDLELPLWAQFDFRVDVGSRL